MWYQNIRSALFNLVTIHASDGQTDGQTDGQNSDNNTVRCITCSRTVKTINVSKNDDVTYQAQQHSHRKQRLKRCVLRRLQKTGSDCADVTCCGRLPCGVYQLGILRDEGADSKGLAGSRSRMWDGTLAREGESGTGLSPPRKN